MKDDMYPASRLLTCAGALTVVSGILFAVRAAPAYGGILHVLRRLSFQTGGTSKKSNGGI